MDKKLLDAEWQAYMAELEEKLGPIVPNGASGGVGAKLAAYRRYCR